MASQPSPRLDPSKQHGSPYCSDLNCQSCTELHEVQEANPPTCATATVNKETTLTLGLRRIPQRAKGGK
jgi:hypothetical protein